MDEQPTRIADLPDPSDNSPYQILESELVGLVRSFPIGSSGGPDGFRPQLLVDLINNKESSQDLIQALTGFVNIMLRGGCPEEVRRLMFGGTLIALSKSNGGLRPIVIGYVWRRLTAKAANKYAVDKLASFFTPLQVGIATPGGCETAVHAARAFVTNMPQGQVFVKLDFSNAFNTLRRDVMLRAVHETMPDLYPFIHQAYAAESMLQFGEFVVRSQMGPQQGDPLGPLLFCLPLQPALRSLVSSFRIGYLDDLSLGGRPEDVGHDMDIILGLESTLGLRLNRQKCEILAGEEFEEKTFEDFKRVTKDSISLLGAPLCKGTALDKALQDHSEKLEQAMVDMRRLPTQGALMLIRSCFGAARLTFLLRTTQCWEHPLLRTMDEQMRSGLEAIVNIRLSDIQWTQATLPIREGGLGIRRLQMLASSAYLASAASARNLGSAILQSEDWQDAFKDEILSARRTTLPSGALETITAQKVWDRPLIEKDISEVWASATDPLNRARLGAVTSAHAGDWMAAFPIASCGLCLTDEAVRVAIGLRLGLDLCEPHQCQCGVTTDKGGHHGLVCRLSGGRTIRHFTINDIIWRALQRAEVPSTKEPTGLLRSDGKRPDGATLIPWSRGKYMTWDATSIHTCATSYIHLTSITPGAAAEMAAARKITKYSEIPSTYDFIPVALETMGPINAQGREFLSELGRRLTIVSGEPQETARLFQRLSICTQRFNAVAFRSTFMQLTGEDDR